MTNLLAAAMITALASSEPALTEIKESVTVVTNVVETDNASGCQMYWVNNQTGGTRLAVYHEPHANCDSYVEPTEKTKTTTIRKVFAISFMWRGGKWTIRDGVTISEKVEKWKKKEEWEKVE